MAIRNLDKIFKPDRVAVIGASRNEGTVGYTLFRNLILSEFAGTVYPINPKYESVQGVEAHASMAEVPHEVDLAVIATPAATVPGVVRECGEAGVRGVIIVSAGFREVGQRGLQLEAELRREADRFDGMRIIGPNCLGIISPGVHLNASFAAGMPKAGQVAFVSQSGALCTSVLDWALREEIGFSHFVSIGNAFDVGVADLIDYFATDGRTESLILYAESISDARGFMSAARAFTRDRPMVAYKAGRFAESAQAAASHTGALAGVDSVYEAALARSGVVRLFDVADMFDCVELLSRHGTARAPRGDRLAIITNAGGPGVMASDMLLARGGRLAKLSPQTIARLDQVLPQAWSHGNPVDVLGDAPPDRFAQALRLVGEDEGVDATLVILTPQAMTDGTQTGVCVGEIAAAGGKPVLAAWMGGDSVSEGTRRLNGAGVSTYDTPEQAVRAFMYLVAYARRREVLYETPREIPISLPLDRECLGRKARGILARDGELLSENNAKELLELYGIPTAKPHPASTADEAIERAREIGYPVVLKVLSAQITHKTDVGGVALNLANDHQVRAAYEQVVAAAQTARPDAEIAGVTIQRMIAVAGGIELILGVKKDPIFGPVLMIGAGGVAAEVVRDRALELPPLNERLARRMLESLELWPLLSGYRGRPGANINSVVESLMRLSCLVTDLPEILELDVNPLLATPDRVTALDARVRVDLDSIGKPHRPFNHLAIHPYPEQYVRQRSLKDGTPVVLRPIRPEDEPLWNRMLRQCSPESIWFRFRHVFQEMPHETASRFCFIDYDREIAIVAECDQSDQQSLIGVGRLVLGTDRNSADYAVLVADPWQGKGLGALLTDYCLDIADQMGVRHLTAEATADNERALNLFAGRGFRITPAGDHIMLLRKTNEIAR